jgi:hypothetical protein
MELVKLVIQLLVVINLVVLIIGIMIAPIIIYFFVEDSLGVFLWYSIAPFMMYFTFLLLQTILDEIEYE